MENLLVVGCTFCLVCMLDPATFEGGRNAAVLVTNSASNDAKSFIFKLDWIEIIQMST